MAKELKSKFDLSVTAYDEMFMTEDQRAENQLPKIHKIPIAQISDFPDHPYRVLDDEDMNILKESIQERGLITPVTVRQVGFDQYEMISGHRRKRACELLGMDSIDAKVIECSRDEAVVLMVDSNSQRSQMFPTDKGKAYKMKLEAMNRMPGRPAKDNLTPLVSDSEKLRTNEELGQEVGESREQIRRYIRLTYLTPELQEYVDFGQMKMRPAVELSYCSEETQRNVVDRILETDAFPSHDQAIRIRKADEQGYATYECIQDIMDEQKPNQKPKFKFSYERLDPLIPQGLTVKEQEDFVVKALETYKRLLQKQREGR